jgi:hypothetical protein
VDGRRRTQGPLCRGLVRRLRFPMLGQDGCLIQQFVEFPRGGFAGRGASQMAPCLLLIEPHDQGRIAQRSRLRQEFPNPVMVLSRLAGGREQLLQSLAPFPDQGG